MKRSDRQGYDTKKPNKRIQNITKLQDIIEKIKLIKMEDIWVINEIFLSINGPSKEDKDVHRKDGGDDIMKKEDFNWTE